MVMAAVFLRELFRYVRRRLARAEFIGSGERSAQHAERGGRINVRVREAVRLLHRAVEIRADDVAVKIADDEQRRIEQRFPVAEKLLVGFFEIFTRPLVFPSEAIAFPHVGKAALFARGQRLARGVEIEKLGVLRNALLETKRVVAGRVCLNRRRHAEHPAQVGKMILIRRAFLAGKLRPFRLKLCRGHLAARLEGQSGQDKPQTRHRKDFTLFRSAASPLAHDSAPLQTAKTLRPPTEDPPRRLNRFPRVHERMGLPGGVRAA